MCQFRRHTRRQKQISSYTSNITLNPINATEKFENATTAGGSNACTALTVRINHMITVQSKFSKRSVLEMFSVPTKTRRRFQYSSGLKSVFEKLHIRWNNFSNLSVIV